MFNASSWHDEHGSEGGEDSVDSQLLAELRERVGATIMGRGMYSGGSGPWARSDPRAAGWWGEDPPFHQPVFVLTSHAREPLPMQGGTTYTFVHDGIESALEQARAAADGKDVHVAGGAAAISQYMAAGALDELTLAHRAGAAGRRRAAVRRRRPAADGAHPRDRSRRPASLMSF